MTRDRHNAGDGFLAVFDAPARAVTCAARIAESLHALGIRVRIAVHTGEVEIVGDDVRDVAVHMAAPGLRTQHVAGRGGVEDRGEARGVSSLGR